MFAFNGIDSEPPLQMDEVEEISKLGRGFTTTFNCCDCPGQPLNVGIIE
jgi:hypothetical protein